VTGEPDPGVAQQRRARYVPGGMILDADQPLRVFERSAKT
jgi:hypothetical protein